MVAFGHGIALAIHHRLIISHVRRGDEQPAYVQQIESNQSIGQNTS